MNTSNRQLINRLFHTDEERNLALDDAYDAGVAASIMRSRHERNMTQTQLAEAMDASQSYIAQLENAVVLPSHKKLKQIARVLKATLIHPQIVITDSIPNAPLNLCQIIKNDVSVISSSQVKMKTIEREYAF